MPDSLSVVVAKGRAGESPEASAGPGPVLTLLWQGLGSPLAADPCVFPFPSRG